MSDKFKGICKTHLYSVPIIAVLSSQTQPAYSLSAAQAAVTDFGL